MKEVLNNYASHRINTQTGMVSIRDANDVEVALVNYKEFFDLLDDALEDKVRALELLRDPSSDLQNLWGRKPDFKDDLFKRASPIRRPNGYANEFDVDDWRP